jgi:hypothetical protein
MIASAGFWNFADFGGFLQEIHAVEFEAAARFALDLTARPLVEGILTAS